MGRFLRIALLVVGVLFVVILIGLTVISSTDYGHNLVRRQALKILEGQAHGIVKMGRISGNLLNGITVEDFSITDSAGRPFFAVEKATAGYALGGFLRKKVTLNDVTLVRPVIVLDKLPGQDWNYKRIFPGDSLAPKDTTFGFGDWLVFNDVTMVQGRVMVKRPWSPDSTLSEAAQDSAIAEALAGGTRAHVVVAEGGHQQVMDFRDISGEFPLARLAHPDEDAARIEVAKLAMIAAPFRPPVAEVRDLVGAFEYNGDSLWFSEVEAELPASKISGGGSYVFEPGDVALHLVGAPASLGDLRWIYPRLPAQGGGPIEFIMAMHGDTMRYEAPRADLAVGSSRIAGSFGITITDTMALHGTDLRFTSFDTRLIEQLVDGLELPRRGTLTGRAALNGGVHYMNVNGDIAFNDQQTGRSRVAARGAVGMVEGGGARAQDLRLTLESVQVALARMVMPDLPIAGAVSGTATLDGTTETTLAATANLVHTQESERSHLVGRGAVRMTGGTTWMDIDAQARPISLVTVGRFAPAIGLRGSAMGPIRVTGSLGNLAVRGDLTLSPGGALLVNGKLDLTGTPAYDMSAVATVFDANAIIAKAPHTALTARATARGTGFALATMRSNIAADVQTSTFDSIGIDSARIRVAIANGVARLEPMLLSGPAGFVEARGDFGLVAGRSGEIAYRAQLDSLSVIDRWLPGDTAVTVPRPRVTARALQQAREDSARMAAATEVERAVLGTPAPKLVVDTPRTVRNDSISGSLYAAGTMRGNLSGFDLRGRVAAQDVVLRGNSIRRARAEYGWIGAMTPNNTMLLAAHADSAMLAGFQLDSLDARLSYTGPGGTAVLAIHQDNDREYSANVGFALHLDHKEIHFTDLALRFDTTRWVASRPGTVRWGGRGIEVETIELRSGPEGRIYVNGLIPTEGQADLELAVTNFEISHLVDLLQSDIEATGLVSVTASAEGTTSNPRFRGAAGFVGGSYGGTALPDLHGTFNYASRRLTTKVQAARNGGMSLATLEAQLPINLAISGVQGPRLPDGPVVIDLVADSLPLDVLPQFTDAITDVRGRVIGSVAVRGTMRNPQTVGALALDLGSFGIAPLGVVVRDIRGNLRMQGDTIVVDSIIGRSGGGTVRLAGGLGVETLTAPSFDLELLALDARVLNNETGRIRADASIHVEGPFDGVHITGGATLRDGIIYIPETGNKEVIGSNDPALYNVLDTSMVADEALFPSESPLLANLQMDVNVRIMRDTWVRSPDANVEIFTDPEAGDLNIHIDRRADAIVLDGFVNTDRGEYTFMSKRFQIRRGSATFIGGQELDPTLQITGEYPVEIAGREALTIRVVIGGTLSAPRISLESDAQPPIPQSDLIAYLAFGRGSSSLLQVGGSGTTSGGSVGGALVGTVGAAATRGLVGVALGVVVDELEGEASRALGADVFNISPGDVPTEVSAGGVGGFLQGTEVEAGVYTDRNTFFAVQTQASPSWAGLGIRVERRFGRGLRVETSFAPRYFLAEPTLGTQPAQSPTTSFGAFLIKEWRF